jgi:hypothetical protein
MSILWSLLYSILPCYTDFIKPSDVVEMIKVGMEANLLIAHTPRRIQMLSWRNRRAVSIKRNLRHT